MAGTQTRSVKKDFYFSQRTGVLSFRDTELRSSANSLTHMSHSGRRMPRRRLAAYPAVNSPMIAVSTTNACSSAAGSLAGRVVSRCSRRPGALVPGRHSARPIPISDGHGQPGMTNDR